MKNHLTILGLAIALCTFIVAQGSINRPIAPAKSAASYTDQQDTSKQKMHKKWKKTKDSTWHKEKRDTSMMHR